VNKMLFTRCCFISISTLLATLAHAQMPDEPQVTFLATDPAPDAQLAHNERFYVHFAVKSAVPVAVMINAYTKGNPVFADMGSSAVNLLPAGDDTAVAHFFYWGAMTRHIDEVRLTVGTSATPGKGKEFALLVNLTLTTKDAAGSRPLAPWVLEWQRGGMAQAKQAPGLPAAETKSGPDLTMVVTGITILAAVFAAALRMVLRSRNKISQQ
jgi:hypothetical protein